MVLFTPNSAPPKVKNIKIIGHLRENSKVTVTATVTGGTEGSSRVQWFKTSSSTLDGENSLDALITAKIAKVGKPVCLFMYTEIMGQCLLFFYFCWMFIVELLP
jgi:hypothetical protein